LHKKGCILNFVGRKRVLRCSVKAWIQGHQTTPAGAVQLPAVEVPGEIPIKLFREFGDEAGILPWKQKLLLGYMLMD
jgi:hypothetical protein